MMPGRLVHVTVASVFGYTTPGGTPPAKLASKGRICWHSARAHGMAWPWRAATHRTGLITHVAGGGQHNETAAAASNRSAAPSQSCTAGPSMGPCPGSSAIENNITESIFETSTNQSCEWRLPWNAHIYDTPSPAGRLPRMVDRGLSASATTRSDNTALISHFTLAQILYIQQICE
jgi:hypothetical protein